MPIFQVPTQEILFGPSPIDWCEANQPESNPFHWQELHNTWSNVAYVVSGLIMVIFHLRQKAPTDPLFLLSNICCILTGISSAWFHSTLIFVAQKTDEFFENAMLAAMLYSMLFPLITPSTKIPPSTGVTRYIAVSIHLVFLALGMLFIPEAFAEIHLLVAVLTFFYKLTQRTKWITDPAIQQKILGQRNLSMITATTAFALWGVDRAHCTPFVQGLHLHAFAWHWGTSAALSLGSISAMVVMESYYNMNSIKVT